MAYYEADFKEPWYVFVPPSIYSLLNDRQVVELYRERMQSEQSFRDFKTHLKLRGLHLNVAVAVRMGRLFLAFCLEYILCVLLGESPMGCQAREVFERPRRHPRLGTTRTLSDLSVSMLTLSHPDWFQQSLRYLLKLVFHATKRHALLPKKLRLIPP